ncbi:SDR family NAD(P)-dependent oxidoreductase [Sphingobacterium sp.]|uniref:SDR family NAD(P)-dependent oxidoreductase n=1 Tax=Sphingobacterium sp. TaxID=341027 RepID=UPI002FDCAD07
MKVFIAGGTSGIGLALAERYLQKGASVAVCGRDLAKLRAIPFVDQLSCFEVDVCQIDDLQDAVNSFCTDGPLALFINCTGSYADDVAQQISYQEALAMLQVNMMGTLNCFEVARATMEEQSEGQIVVVASVSGTLHFPNSSLYSKTKRAAIQIADAYRRALLPFGIAVTVIAPGYVDTEKLREINRQDLSKKPFLISVDDAAQRIMIAIQQKKKLVIFPKRMKWLMACLGILPNVLLNKIMSRKAQWMKND